MFRKTKTALEIIKMNGKEVCSDSTSHTTIVSTTMVSSENSKTSDRYIQLVKAILDCRMNGKILIVGLCDRGTAALNDFVEEGEGFISYLQKVETFHTDETARVESNKVDLNYLLNKNVQEIDKGSLKSVHVNGKYLNENKCEQYSDEIRNECNNNAEKMGLENCDNNCNDSEILGHINIKATEAKVTRQNENQTQVNSEEFCEDLIGEDKHNRNCECNNVVNHPNHPDIGAEGMDSLQHEHNDMINSISQSKPCLEDPVMTCLEMKAETDETQIGAGCCTEGDSEYDDTMKTVQSLLKDIPDIHRACAELTKQLQNHKTACMSNTGVVCSVCRCPSKPNKSKLEIGITNMQQDNAKELFKQISELQCLKDTLEQKLREVEDTNSRLVERNLGLNQRLSAEMSAKVSADETDLENIAISNRPMNIAEQYINLCSLAWLDAKNALDKYFDNFPEEMKLKFLCDILMISEKEASNLQKQFMKKITFLINHPLENEIKEANCDADNITAELPCNLLNVLSDFARNKADVVNIEYLIQVILNNILGDKPPLHIGTSTDDMFLRACNIDEIKCYIEQCARIAWKMVLQRPPMSFDNTTGVKEVWLSQYQEVYYNCDGLADPSCTVDFYVQPIMKHKKHMMAKGRVFIKKK